MMDTHGQSHFRILHDPRIELSARVGALTDLVFVLMAEVEALRAAQIQGCDELGVRPAQTAYGLAYVQTGLLTHNAAGVSCGQEKLLQHFVAVPVAGRVNHAAGWPELAMLRRLGFSADEIAAYVQRAQFLETLT